MTPHSKLQNNENNGRGVQSKSDQPTVLYGFDFIIMIIIFPYVLFSPETRFCPSPFAVPGMRTVPQSNFTEKMTFLSKIR